MKAKKLALVSSAFALLGVFALSITTSETKVSAEGEVTSETVSTDYNAFKIRKNSNGSIAPDATNNAITFTGGWDCNFAVTDQFDTRAGNYSLKAHVYNTDWTIDSDITAGFTIYYDDNNLLNLYLKWNNEQSTTCFAEGVISNKTGGATGGYQSAILPNGVFETRTEFTDIWSDGANWTVNGLGTNLRDNSTILVSKGFDMTLHVERATYSNRAVDVVQLQVDAYGADGSSALTAYSPKYAIDAFTNPSGAGTSALIDRKPQIGFNQNNMSAVYSDIVFTDKNTEKVNAKITRVGAKPSVGTVDSENDTITHDNSNFASGFMMTDFATTSDESFDVQATVSGTNGNAKDTQLGFSYYFDDNNYAIIYARWDGTTTTIDGVHALFKVNGNTTNVASATRDPWGQYSDQTDYNYVAISEIYDAWSDYSGWITDSYAPGDFNKIRSESALTIQSGFTFGLQRMRTTFLNRSVDAFQFRVSAKGTDNVYHNWYSPTFCVDAYTCPNGGEVSTLVDKAPQIGFYSHKVGEITLSNIKYNGKKVEVSYSEKEQGRIDARIFVDNYLHFSDVSKEDGTEGTDCKGTNGYYAQAKEGWNSLGTDARYALVNDDEFADARARLLAWASANNETFDASTYSLISKSNNIFKGASSSGYDTTTIVAVSVSTLIVTLGTTIIFIRKKKASDK